MKLKKEKGLYISYYYLPVLVPRSIVAYKHLENSSYPFDVYCAETERKEKDNILQHQKEINIYRDYKTNSVLKKFIWVKKSLSFFKKNRNKYQFIMTSYMPLYSLMSGIYIKKKYPDIPWISYYSDPPAINLNKKISLRKKIFMFLEKYYAKVSYKMADLLVFTNQEQLEYCLGNSKYKNKAVVLSHSYEEKLYPPKMQRNDDRIVISHFGRLYGDRTALPFLKALNLLKNENINLYKKIECHFYGKISEDQITFINEKQLDCIEIHNFVNYTDSLKYMTQSDYLLCIDAFLEEKNNVFFPSKLADYIGSYTPIIAIVPNGTTKKIVSELGYIIISQNEEEIYELLVNIINGNIKIQPNIEMIKKYDSKLVSKKLDNYIVSLIKNNAKRGKS